MNLPLCFAGSPEAARAVCRAASSAQVRPFQWQQFLWCSDFTADEITTPWSSLDVVRGVCITVKMLV